MLFAAAPAVRHPEVDMLAPLLALALTAAPSDRCQAIWSGIEQGKDFKQDVVGNMLHGDASKIAKLRDHFLEGCGALPDAEQACGTAHPGRQLFRICPALGRVFHESATQPDVSGNELAKLREEGLAREAVAKLRDLGQNARMLRLRSGPSAEFAFPADAGPSPAVDCCATPTRTCAPDPKLWANPTWKALGFSPAEPLRFHYSFQSTGKGREASFVIRAEGDPDCSGQKQVWEVNGQSTGGKFVVSDAEKK